MSFVFNVNMADAAAARREARRKRILENSHNRLQLISGKCGDEYSKESLVRTIIPDQIYESPAISENDSCSKPSLHNGVMNSEPDKILDLLSTNLNRDIAAGDGEVPNDLAPFAAPAAEPVPMPPFWEKLTNNKYDIVLLSLVIQLLYSLSLVTFDDTYFFLPVLIYIITKLIWFPSQSSSQFSSALQLLQVMSSSRVQNVIYVTQCLGVISCDICIFLFTTICIQSFLITLTSGSNT
ncbi:unnamed protein product [Chrysodeixis includens]|uniref:Uncharacterized protein n=1 Tax=Chrysodeixis includens TaxID=689277 RepID=A0A9P0BRE8_CHRIL|nr:unnamed protein product [Chrysodeixis includens]